MHMLASELIQHEGPSDVGVSGWKFESSGWYPCWVQ